MNTYTGEVKQFQSLEALRAANDPPTQAWKEIDIALLPERTRLQLEATGRTRLSRNSACPCSSGKRLKNCCYTGPDK